MPRAPLPEPLTLPTANRMAEVLEDTEPGDADRRMDAHNFRKDQAQFRDAFDAHGHSELALLVLDGNVKKEVVNTLRRLQRAKFALEKIPEKEAVEGLITKMNEVYEDIGRVSKGDQEFTMSNVPLPDFDETAVEQFFGHNANTSTRDSLKDLQSLNKAFTEKVNEVLGAAQLLLNEYEELRNYLKQGGTPLSPLPK